MPTKARPDETAGVWGEPWSFEDRSGERPPPPDDASDLDWLLYRQCGVLRLQQAESLLSEGAVRRLVDSGRWQRPARGVVVAHNGPLTREQQLWAAILFCGDGAVLGGVTAACAAGLQRRSGTTVHVVLPARRRADRCIPRSGSMPPIRVHRSTLLPDKDLFELGSPPRTAIARSLVDAAQWAGSDEEARAIVVAGCQQRLTRSEEILAVIERMPRARRRALVLETIGYVRLGAEAVSEIDFVKLCRAYGLPQPDMQRTRTDATGRVRYLDAFWEEYRIHAEVDGGYHLTAESYWADMERQNGLWIDGELVLRFAAWGVRHQPERVANQLRRALLLRGWRP